MGMLLDLFRNKWPYTDFHELNADWIISAVRELIETMDSFIQNESISFADPITWNISSQYAKATVVIDNAGNAYLSKQAVPAGIQLNNSEYWQEIFNFTTYTRTANRNLTFNVETNTTRATADYSVDDWLILNDVLYRVTQAIAIDDTFIIAPASRSNIVHFTVENFIKAWMTTATALINQYKDEIDASELAYRQQLAQDIASTTASLQAQLNAAIAGATVDSEVINARVGDDGITYATLGDAIRGQFSDIKKLVPHGWVNVDAATLDFANGRLENNNTINTTYNTRQWVLLDPTYDYFVWCEPDAKIIYSTYNTDVIIANNDLMEGANKVPGFVEKGVVWEKVIRNLIGGRYNYLFIAYDDDSAVDSSLYSKIHIYRTPYKHWTQCSNVYKKIANKFVSATGTFTLDSDNYECSAFIKVENETRIYFRSTKPLSNIAMAYYDAGGVFIDRIVTGFFTGKSQYYYAYIDIPNTAIYAIFSFINPDHKAYISVSFDAYSNDTELYISGESSDDGIYKETFINKLPDDYKGKIISFLGDSITTYAGDNASSAGDGHLIADGVWTYAGNHCRYPQANLFQSPFFCYWVKLFLSLGMTLGINDSWAGSLVSWDGTESDDKGANIYIASPTRIAHLNENGTPNIIVVNAGTNDIIQNVPIGTFNTENPANYTNAQIAALPVDTFADAYRALVIRLMKRYPVAQIVCMLPNFTNSIYYDAEKVDRYCEVIKTICDYFGLYCIDMRNSAITIYNTSTYLGDGVHPNEKGMQNLFRNLYKYFLYEM